MTDALEDHEGTVSTGGRTITIFRFADDIDGLDGDQCREDQADDKQHQWLNTEIKVNRQKHETVTRFKYLGSVIADEGSKPEIISRIAKTTAAMTRLKQMWNDRSISLSSKIQLMHSLVTSIFLYACELWTLTAELQRRI